MASHDFQIYIRKFQPNPLLKRKQFVVDVNHYNRGTVSKQEMKEKIAKDMRVADVSSIILFGFKTAFGSGRTRGFGLIYDSQQDAKKFEKSYRLIRNKVIEKPPVRPTRKFKKDLKNRKKKVRGTAKAKVTAAAKKK
eukprot:GHVU01108315.1.p2 GENE.GHVU01108315.1~~GHVU01108315.1.p2  ORF type:complete len:137 (-),score=36.24 GHVU01108315.1:1573-1983(-)